MELLEGQNIECRLSSGASGWLPKMQTLEVGQVRTIIRNCGTQGGPDWEDFPQVEEVRKMKIGNPLDRDTTHGPQNHQAHLRKLIEYCQRGVKEGATLVCGGNQVPRPGQS